MPRALLLSVAAWLGQLPGCVLAVDADALDRGCGSDRKACDGRCVPKTDPEYGCGATSCQPCFLPNAESTCDAERRCAIASCINRHEDCDRLVDNGCEVNLDTNVDHCGSCDAAPCKVPGAIAACARGTCAIRQCLDGYKDCDRRSANGCEARLASDADNCGACGAACDGGASCDAGRCQPE